MLSLIAPAVIFHVETFPFKTLSFDEGIRDSLAKQLCHLQNITPNSKRQLGVKSDQT